MWKTNLVTVITVLPIQNRLQDNLILCIISHCSNAAAKDGKSMLKWLSVTASKSFSKALLAKMFSYPICAACLICPHINCLHLAEWKYGGFDKWFNKMLLIRFPPIFVLSTDWTTKATSISKSYWFKQIGLKPIRARNGSVFWCLQIKNYSWDLSEGLS